MRRFGLGVLGSGRGSNCRAILNAIRASRLQAEVRLVVADVFDAGILDVAQEFGVPNVYLPAGKFRTILEPDAEQQLVTQLQEADIDLVALAGFMRVLKTPMLEAFPRKIINVHPSLLPKFPGRKAWTQALLAGERVTGCTVHYVDAGVDTGEIIAQREVPILPDDTPEMLHLRIQEAEHELYPQVIGELGASFALEN